MSLTFLILAVSLSLASTNDYVYTKPQNIEIAGESSFGSDGLVRGEDVAFALEAWTEREACLKTVNVGMSYDASLIASSKINDIQAAKDEVVNTNDFWAFVAPSGPLPDSIVIANRNIKFASVVSAIGGRADAAGLVKDRLYAGYPLMSLFVGFLVDGLDSFSRVAQWGEASTDFRGAYENSKLEYGGQPAEVWDDVAHNFMQGEFPTNPQPVHHEIPGVSSVKGAFYQVSVWAQRDRQTAWKGEIDGEGRLVWVADKQSSTGPRTEYSEHCIEIKGSCWQDFVGVEARVATNATVLAVYAICDYEHGSLNGMIREASAAIKLTGSAQYDYRPYPNASDHTSVVFELPDSESLFDIVLNALGETRITANSVGGKTGNPEAPQSPVVDHEIDKFEVTSSGDAWSEYQKVKVDCLVYVYDFDFNAKTL